MLLFRQRQNASQRNSNLEKASHTKVDSPSQSKRHILVEYGGPSLQDRQTSNSDTKIRSIASYYYYYYYYYLIVCRSCHFL